MSKSNGKVNCEYYRGTRLVFAPTVKWYHFGLPYSSEMERLLEPARHFEEEAVLVAPDNFTALMLKLESFSPHVPVVIGTQQARRVVDNRQSPAGNGNGSV